MTPARWLDGQRRRGRPWLTLAALGTALGGLLVIPQAWLLAGISDAAIFHWAGLDAVRHPLAALLALLAVRATLAWFAERAAVRGAAAIRVAVRAQVFRHIQALGPTWAAGERAGALVADLTKGIEGLTAYYARYLPAVAATLLIPAGVLAVVASLDWLSALILMVTAPLIPVFMVLIGGAAEQKNRAQWRELARMAGYFLESLQGLVTLKLFNADAREAAAIARVSEDYRRSTMEVLRIAFLSSAALELFASLGIAMVAVTVGFRLYGLELPLPGWARPPALDFRTGFFILLLAPEMYQPLRNLATHYHGRLQGVTAAERLLAVLETAVPRVEGPRSRRPVTGVPPRLEFEGVRVSYGPGRIALDGLDLAIAPGERVALVGPSGAGKSTLARTLLGFVHPDAGRVLVDGIDLALLDLDDWRRHLAWVPQSPRLFAGNILDNVRLGRPDATLPAVREAARLAGALGFVESLPRAWDTPVGERGAGLSGGEVQRIALARAFLRDAPLVILDEPTASLDPETEAAVQTAIESLARARTLVVLAHRLATVERADRILVLERGRIAESGRHAELLARGGLYARLVSAQGGGA